MPPRIPRPSGSSRSLARYYFRKLGVTTFENCVTQLFSRCFSVVVMHQRSVVTSGASAAPVHLCCRCVCCSGASDEKTRCSGASDEKTHDLDQQTHRRSRRTRSSHRTQVHHHSRKTPRKQLGHAFFESSNTQFRK